MEPSSIFNHPLPFQNLKIQLLKAKTIDEISSICQQNQDKFDLKNQNNPDYDFLKCLIILVKSFQFGDEKFKISYRKSSSMGSQPEVCVLPIYAGHASKFPAACKATPLNHQPPSAEQLVSGAN